MKMSSLVAKLKSCPTHDTGITNETVLDAWEALRREEGSAIKPSPAIMAALLFQNEHVKALLTKAEQDQLVSIVGVARQRYQQAINPPNKLGKLIFGRIQQI